MCIHNDGKGNVSALIDNTQAVVASYAYDPFGKLMKKSGTLDQPYTFSTREAQYGTGQYYYGYRFYDSCSGKWSTRDPLGERADMNVYRMVGNNPVNAIDPNGKAAFRYHFFDGFRVGMIMGMWIGDSLKLGWATMMPDFDENKKVPRCHATTNSMRVSTQDAINNSLIMANDQWRSGTTQGMGNAIHIWRDVVSHGGSYFPDPNATTLDYAQHIYKHDLLPGGSFHSVIIPKIRSVRNLELGW